MLKIEYQVFYIKSEILDALITFFTIFLQGLSNYPLKLDGSIRKYVCDRCRFFIDDGSKGVGRGVALKGHRAGKHFVEHYAQAPNIGALIHYVSACLFGR